MRGFSPFQNRLGNYESKWLRLRAAADLDDIAEHDIFNDLLSQHWEAVYAFFCAQRTSVETAEAAVAWFTLSAPGWLLRWPQAWMLHGRFRLTVRYWLERESANLVSQALSSPHSARIPSEWTREYEALVPQLLTQKLTALQMFDHVWSRTIHWRALKELDAEWKDVGRHREAEALVPARDTIPPQPDFIKAPECLGLDAKEARKTWFRWHTRYLKLLRKRVEDTVASAVEADKEWAELFPQLLSWGVAER